MLRGRNWSPLEHRDDRLVKRYGDVLALDHVDLAVAQGRGWAARPQRRGKVDAAQNSCSVSSRSSGGSARVLAGHGR